MRACVRFLRGTVRSTRSRITIERCPFCSVVNCSKIRKLIPELALPTFDIIIEAKQLQISDASDKIQVKSEASPTMRTVSSIIKSLTDLFDTRFNFTLVLIITTVLLSSRLRKLSDFVSGLYLRYTYLRLNHSIKAVLASKKELTQAHIDPIALRKWKEVIAWITFHPEDLLLVDKKKQSVLHHCCLFRAPAVVIEMILFQAPELVSKKNQDGEIPLNWAVRLSAPNEVLQLLLSVDPALGCISKDKQGNTALSLIWERHGDILLEMWWNEGKEQITEYHWWKRILYLLECYHNANMSSESHTHSLKSDSVDNNHIDDNIKSPFLELHAATKCPGCPVSLFQLMLKVYGSQIRQKDENGRLPLTVACLDAVNNRSSGVLTKIQLLLSEYPEAVDVIDNYLRLPIFVALESGIVMDEGIADLLQASPRCLQLFDPVTNLAPFLVAASGSQVRQHRTSDTYAIQNSYSSEPASVETRSLNTIYSLLRADPSQLSRQRSILNTG